MAWHSFFRMYLVSFFFWLAIVLQMLQKTLTCLCSSHKDHIFILNLGKNLQNEFSFLTFRGLYFLEWEAWIRTVCFLSEAFLSMRVFFYVLLQGSHHTDQSARMSPCVFTGYQHWHHGRSQSFTSLWLELFCFCSQLQNWINWNLKPECQYLLSSSQYLFLLF